MSLGAKPLPTSTIEALENLKEQRGLLGVLTLLGISETTVRRAIAGKPVSQFYSHAIEEKLASLKYLPEPTPAANPA
jgi:hypothetical protein